MMDVRRTGPGDGPYEFRDASRSLVIRGDHAEWVLQAAADILARHARLAAEAAIDEITVLHRLGAADVSDLTDARARHRRRFDVAARCDVSFGNVNYVWAAADSPPARRVASPPLQPGPEMLVLQGSADLRG